MKGPRGVELLQGELITLAASAARTADGVGDWIFVGGERARFMVLLDITASATDATDVLDVFIDVSLDGTNSAGNAMHFTQQAGNGAAAKEFGVLRPLSPGTSTIPVTTDAAATTVRPGLFGPYYRARWEITDSGNADQSHTFSVVMYATGY
jgi:hypothetical protein